MSSRKIIAVVGATGSQGGGLARAILNDAGESFAARALTRNPGSDRAAELARLGAEVVHAELDDPGSVAAAFEGAHAAFCVTNYWEHFSPDRELSQAANMARAAREAGLEHLIWSTLEDTRLWVPLDNDRMPTLMEKYKVPHFDAKGEANHLFVDAGVATTFLLTSFYWDNFIHLGLGPKRDADGVLVLTLPLGDAKLPGIAAADIGKCAYGVVKRGDEYKGKTVGIAGGHLSGKEMAAAMSNVLGRKVRYNAVSPDDFRSFGFPGADDLGNMFQFKRDFSDYYCSARDLDESRALNPELQTFDAWLPRNKELIPME